MGIQGAAASKSHKDSGLTMAELGAVHEYGTARVPQRSFLRGAIDEDPQRWTNELKKQLQRVAHEGANPKQAMRVVAEMLRKRIIERIDDHIDPPLADSTIARKGGETTPLVETGALRGSITAQVGDSDETEE